VDTSVLNILCLFGADLGTGSNIIMPDKLPRGVKLLAVELDAKGWSQAEIASHLGISVDTITKAKRNMREYGDVERPEKKRGPKRKMDPGMQEVLTFFYFLIMVGPYCAYSTSTGGGFEGLHEVVGANVCCGDFGKHIISVFGRSRDNLESGEDSCYFADFKASRRGKRT